MYKKILMVNPDGLENARFEAHFKTLKRYVWLGATGDETQALKIIWDAFPDGIILNPSLTEGSGTDLMAHLYGERESRRYFPVVIALPKSARDAAVPKLHRLSAAFCMYRSNPSCTPEGIGSLFDLLLYGNNNAEKM